jgi:hypothetical protein
LTLISIAPDRPRPTANSGLQLQPAEVRQHVREPLLAGGYDIVMDLKNRTVRGYSTRTRGNVLESPARGYHSENHDQR